ncbi:hypothetical protein [Lentzea sp. NPDC051838]|uniref:hypothetical protein n=1 Tax=Lentzea sp. NPDC051838 TaxID=3154849 RepID=UPI00341764EA
MKKLVASAVLTGAVLAGFASPAFADPAVVDKPDTSGLSDKWTTAPLGVPVFGLIESVVKAPNYIIPN